MKNHRKLKTTLVITLLVVSSSVFATVKVAVVQSWSTAVLPVFNELNQNWSIYGTTPLSIDTSLSNRDFTYQDLVNTNANVLWLSDPAGGQKQYSTAEISAIGQYVQEGHSILGTFMVFQHTIYDNRALATLFGLPRNINYNTNLGTTANRTFDILGSNPLFRNLPDPYISSGWTGAQIPADLTWDAGDLGGAQLLAKTADNRGVITWYQTPSYHAIFSSEMIEYYGSSSDTQFLYNALTVPEPATLLLLGLGGMILRKLKSKSGEEPQGSKFKEPGFPSSRE